jgi:hypothetical protein
MASCGASLVADDEQPLQMSQLIWTAADLMLLAMQGAGLGRLLSQSSSCHRGAMP